MKIFVKALSRLFLPRVLTVAATAVASLYLSSCYAKPPGVWGWMDNFLRWDENTKSWTGLEVELLETRASHKKHQRRIMALAPVGFRTSP